MNGEEISDKEISAFSNGYKQASEEWRTANASLLAELDAKKRCSYVWKWMAKIHRTVRIKNRKRAEASEASLATRDKLMNEARFALAAALKERDELAEELERAKDPMYCARCKSCGEEGCCPATMCLYGGDTGRRLEAAEKALSAERERGRAMLRESMDDMIGKVDAFWSFNDNQTPTASWHDKNDCLDGMRTYRDLRLSPQADKPLGLNAPSGSIPSSLSGDRSVGPLVSADRPEEDRCPGDSCPHGCERAPSAEAVKPCHKSIKDCPVCMERIATAIAKAEPTKAEPWAKRATPLDPCPNRDGAHWLTTEMKCRDCGVEMYDGALNLPTKPSAGEK